MSVLLFVLSAVTGYLFGSVSFAVLVSKRFLRRDVRTLGSGNAGTTNVLRSAGLWPGILTFTLDFLKAAAACLVAKYLIFGVLSRAWGTAVPTVYGVLVCGIACQLGHIFPLFFEFRGGKAVACTAGIFSVCNWKVLVLCVAVFLLVFVCSRIVSAASVSAMVVLPFAEFFTAEKATRPVATVLSAVIALIVVLVHKDNLVRLVHGEEKKLTLGRRK